MASRAWKRTWNILWHAAAIGGYDGIVGVLVRILYGSLRDLHPCAGVSSNTYVVCPGIDHKVYPKGPSIQ